MDSYGASPHSVKFFLDAPGSQFLQPGSGEGKGKKALPKLALLQPGSTLALLISLGKVSRIDTDSDDTLLNNHSFL